MERSARRDRKSALTLRIRKSGKFYTGGKSNKNNIKKVRIKMNVDYIRICFLSTIITFISICCFDASASSYTMDSPKLTRRSQRISENRSGQRASQSKNSLTTNRLYNQFNGLFGKKIAEQIEDVPSDLSAESKIYFIPEKQFLGYNVYYVCVTPKTHLVYKIVACAVAYKEMIKNKKMQDAFPLPKFPEVKELPILAKKAIEKKFDAEMVKKPDIVIRYEMDGVYRDRIRRISVIGGSHNNSVSLVDSLGYAQAKKEQAELDAEKAKRIDAQRNATAWDAIDAL